MENSQYLQTMKSDDDFEIQNSNFSTSSSTGSKFSALVDPEKNGTVLIEKLQKKVELLDQKLFDIQNLTLLKEEELNELRSSHNRRLERFRALQENYSSLKEQLKNIDDTNSEWNYEKAFLSVDKRARPKDLQQEDSDAVWNELAYFKLQNKNLMWERLEMQEELDRLQVKHSHDTASLLEMRLALQHDREDYEHLLRLKDDGQKTEMEAELKLLRSERSANQAKTEKLEKELKSFHAVRNSLLAERRSLKTEFTKLNEIISKHRIDSVNLRHHITSLKKRLHQEVNRVQKLEQQLRVIRNIQSSSEQKLPNQDSDSKQVVPEKLNADNNRKVSHNPHRSPGSSPTSPKSPNNIVESWLLHTSLSEPCLPQKLSLNHSGNGLNYVRDISESSSSTRNIKTVVVHSYVKGGARALGKVSRLKHPKHRYESRNRKTSATQCKRNYSESGENVIGSKPQVPIQKVYLRDTSTSPISFTTNKTGYTFRPGNSNRRFGKNEKPRLSELLKQISLLKNYRRTALKSTTEMKETIQQLQTDLILANQKLKVLRQHSQKIQGLYEKLQMEKSVLEKEVKDSQILEGKFCIEDLQKKVSNLQECKKDLEIKLKNYSTEMIRLASLNKVTQTDNENTHNQVKSLTSRVNWLERDISQKRHLIEEQRAKMKEMQDNAKSITDTINVLETSLKQGNNIFEQQKLKNDVIHQRLLEMTKQKEDCEKKHKNLVHILEKKNRQYEYALQQHEKMQAAVSELEKSAQKHIVEIAAQSEAAITNTQSKLIAAHSKIEQFHKFVKILSHELVHRIYQVRETLNKSQMDKIQQQLPSYTSMQKAKDLAKNILNINDLELNDIMKGDDLTAKLQNVTDGQYAKDQRWASLCEETIKSRDDFVLPLLDLFVEKLEEKDSLLYSLYSTKY
ncbi:centlein-like [Octopus bimaculoides]|uniref:centlein-like n=1 Tax=Octopus bimaculoides TaxID=37653 RepID=UPI00071C6B6B|nr:centlein-like [Octopus bimaculoides]XP_014780242.1 centlein-like [Octopus bimaculoides]XP_052833244.1 centlein-like [Octopus bimaculoides]|eukprot:XP_014780235.1 PREDICTED: centlein-like [Octopus bimaculoides]